jgi:2-keto-4-pentenoate hydratase/2-oxohepta-3-ene-1,7-dioic acid hydratase in catechol pathway
MKIIRYRDPDRQIHHAALQPDGSARRIAGDIVGRHEVTGEPARVEKLLAPVQPWAILCIGLNYRKHAEETGAKIPAYPVVFVKLPGALQNPGDPIVLPRHLRSDKVDYECELAVVIGRRCRNVSAAAALDHVLGYTCGNDVSARDWQAPERGGGQWCRAKSFDTFCPLGPCLVTRDEIPDPQRLGLRTRLNGAVMQEGNTDDMLFPVAELIAFVSGSTTLEAGTVILTGTPPGVGVARKPPVFLKPGDEVIVEIDRIGRLTNPVIEEG